ncbi:MAG: hypothetical protein H7343_07485 [Undibacterium sp.]|nr:hypothetical protein [Opitutaceae bacterium]
MYPDESEEAGDLEGASPVVKAKPSLVPSWIMLGFLIGALFVWALPARKPAPPRLEKSEPRTVIMKTVPQFTTVEAVFTEWGKYAVWDNELTEIALWSSETKDYTDCFEVLRSGSSYFFRSIPRLTRPVLTHGTRENSPLQFTETEAQRAEWLGEKRQETWRSLSDAARSKAITSPPTKAPETP